MTKFLVGLLVGFSFSAGALEASPLLKLMGAASVMAVGQTCHSSAECAPDENCKNGVCQYRMGSGMCLNDSECAPNEHCVDLKCRP